jgi:putative NADH-flavin reductase
MHGGISALTNARDSKRLLVLGATGGVGRELVKQALKRGHKVTAFVRSPQKLGGPQDGLKVIRGNLLAEEIGAALAGHDAVISAVGPPGPGRTSVAQESARAIVAAMEATGVRRLLIVGVAVLFEDAGILARLLRRTLLRGVADDSAAMEQIVKATRFDWTIVRPPRLTNGLRTERYGVADDHLPNGAGGASAISRADVAHFILEELDRSEHLRRVVGIANTKAPAAAS